MSKTFVMVFLLALPAVALPPAASFRDGDVVTTSSISSCAVDPTPPAVFATILHDRNASIVRTVSDAEITAMTYWQAQRAIYAAHFTSATGQSIDVLGSDGQFVPFVALPSATAHALTPAGDDLLAAVYAAGGAPSLWRISRGGTVIDKIELPHEDNFISSMDVAADRCTLFYAAQSKAIRRFNICTRQPLQAVGKGWAFGAVRVLPDGGVIAIDGGALTRFDAQGNSTGIPFMMVQENQSLAALTLDQNPSVAWFLTTYGCSVDYTGVSLVQFDVATFKPIASTMIPKYGAGRAVAVMGEWHASVNVLPVRRRTVH